MFILANSVKNMCTYTYYHINPEQIIFTIGLLSDELDKNTTAELLLTETHNFTELILSGNSFHYKDSSLHSILERCPRLKLLITHYATGIDFDVKDLFNRYPALQKIKNRHEGIVRMHTREDVR